MKQSILVAAPSGYGGYGDFLFALKLCAQLREFYKSTNHPMPEIYLISQETGKEKIEKLGGDSEFSVSILTPELLKDKLDSNEIDVAMVIEGPAWGLYNQIDDILTKFYPLKRIPFITFTEYNITCNALDTKFKCLKTITNVNTGFGTPGGVLLSQDLVNPLAPSVLMSQVDERLRNHLFSGCEDIDAYQTQHDLGMQYSHDKGRLFYGPEQRQYVVLHYLNLYSTFIKNSSKTYHDAILIGDGAEKKIGSALSFKKKLIKERNYARIVLITIDDPFNENTNTIESDYEREKLEKEREKLEEETVQKMRHDDGSVEYTLYDSGTEGKTYRIFYVKGMTHQSMNALTSLSCPIMGTTGDQCFIEGACAHKLMPYECFSHKKDFIKRYEEVMNIAANDPQVERVLHLLQWAESVEDYKEFGELARQPEVLSKFNQAYDIVLTKYDMMSYLSNTKLCQIPLPTTSDKLPTFFESPTQQDFAQVSSVPTMDLLSEPEPTEEKITNDPALPCVSEEIFTGQNAPQSAESPSQSTEVETEAALNTLRNSTATYLQALKSIKKKDNLVNEKIGVVEELNTILSDKNPDDMSEKLSLFLKKQSNLETLSHRRYSVKGFDHAGKVFLKTLLLCLPLILDVATLGTVKWFSQTHKSLTERAQDSLFKVKGAQVIDEVSQYITPTPNKK